MSGPAGTPGRRLLVLLLLHSVVTQVVTFVLRPTSAYRALELDVPTAWLGALTASFAVVPLLLAVPSGQATDRFGERRVMLVGAVLMTLSGAVFWTERGGAAGLVLGSVVLGTGHLLSVVGQQAAVANTAGPGRFDTAFGYYTFAASLGQAAGPALITVLGGGGALPDTTPIFATATALGVVLLICTVFLRMPVREQASGDAATGGMGTLLRLPGLLRAGKGFGVMQLAHGIAERRQLDFAPEPWRGCVRDLGREFVDRRFDSAPEHALAQPLCGRVHGHEATGMNELGVGGLELRVLHLEPATEGADSARDDDLAALFQLPRHVRHVALGDLERTGDVLEASLGSAGAAAKAHFPHRKDGRHHRLRRGRGPEFGDGPEVRKVVVAPGEQDGRVSGSAHSQLFETLRSSGADTGQPCRR